MKTATIGPARPPRPPARLTPPSTMAATLEQRVGAGHRRPDAGGRGQGQAAEAPRTGRPACRRRPWSARPRRRCGRPPAGCCRWRTGRGRRSSAAAGSRSTPTMTSEDDERARDEFDARGGPSPSRSASPPSRRPGDFRTTSAAPAQTNDIASVTTMSGTRVMTTSVPLIDAEDEAQDEHAEDDRDRERLGLVLHQDARRSRSSGPSSSRSTGRCRRR